MAHATAASKNGSCSGLKKAGIGAGIGLLILAGAGLGYWLMKPSAEKLLDAETLTPDEIRYVATHLLLHEDIQIRARASAKLAGLGEKAIPVLKDLSLHCDDNELRRVVLELLLAMQAKESDQVLSQLIADRNAEVRRIAANAAGALPPAQSTSLVARSLKDADSGVRAAAINSMARSRDPANIPALKEAMTNDASIMVRRHAARTLEMMTGQKFSDQVKPDPP